MKLHYKGKYDMNPESLPCLPHLPGAVMFKEPTDSKKLAIIANAISFVIMALLAVPVIIRSKDYLLDSYWQLLAGCFVPFLLIFPHELLHAICFKKDVYLYTNFKQGMAFVVGPETMSKGRFVFLSLLPNLVFGVLPYILGLIFPKLVFLSVLGVLCTGMGAGDYFNMFNALTQMPKNARTYMHKFNSYWYIPENK
ncbi:MAG: DUF3267 domain-containing protein [Clostridia bacterium]|nr:DUF3267 domain-containing protein [Clostridia bacterium]